MQTGRTVLIAGGGIAGLILATRLGHSLGRSGTARIVLVDRSPTHVWKPMLHTFAAGTWSAHQQQLLYLAHAWQHHFDYTLGESAALDPTRALPLPAPQLAGRGRPTGRGAPTF